MNPTEVPQSTPEFTPPKEGWLEAARKEAIFDGDEANIIFKDLSEAIAFVANFYAAGRADEYRESERPAPEKGSGELEQNVIDMLGPVVRRLLMGEKSVTYQNEWYVLVHQEKNEKTSEDEYHIRIFGNTKRPRHVKAAFERALEEELIDFDLIKEWDYGKLYERLEERKANH